MDADGTDESILAADFNAEHGIGPVWSPDGDHIVYQRLCFYKPPPSWTRICFEDHEVVVVTVSDIDPLEPGTRSSFHRPRPAPTQRGTQPRHVVARQHDTALRSVERSRGRRSVAVPVGGGR